MTVGVDEDVPIYQRLVIEQGDVVTQVRQSAEELLRETEEAVDFSRPRLPTA
ncbi:hypothetical protein GCM10009801_10080 [Streptomyces albiaxialis]|uniref:Uncharacterized protein n=1 Tax=Streptomyces albiaxialis TaxID=329523 RepID=A0ABN2VL85_9ACTN